MNNNSSDMKTCVDGIVLFAKQPGLTSFSSLNDIKHSLNTKKVGHTGTLDSFAQGLLVVCVGRLTRLAGNITEFDKDYKAIIKFGEETDTLEYTGQIVKTASLPSLEKVQEAISNFQGDLLQAPPMFSAIHVNGMRASDLARNGNNFEIPKRPIKVYSAKLIDYKLNCENLVEYCQIDFSVSKGTYIRSLARDIGEYCGSAAHLAGLYRTRIADFKIEDAAGFSLLDDFNIENTIKLISDFSEEKAKQINLENREKIHKEIKEKISPFSEETAKVSGFFTVHLRDSLFEDCFKNGKKIMKNYFFEDVSTIPENSSIAVFNQNSKFVGLIEKNSQKSLLYKFVIN